MPPRPLPRPLFPSSHRRRLRLVRHRLVSNRRPLLVRGLHVGLRELTHGLDATRDGALADALEERDPSEDARDVRGDEQVDVRAHGGVRCGSGVAIAVDVINIINSLDEELAVDVAPYVHAGEPGRELLQATLGREPQGVADHPHAVLPHRGVLGDAEVKLWV